MLYLQCIWSSTKHYLMILLGQYAEIRGDKHKCGQVLNQLNDYTQKGSVLMSLDQILILHIGGRENQNDRIRIHRDVQRLV